MMTAEELAELFHTSYERLAPEYHYQTRKESAKPWSDVPEPNKQLMIAVAGRVLAHLSQGKDMEPLRDVVFQALGEASLCWSETPKGVFNDVRAVEIGEEVMRAIRHAFTYA